MLNPVPFCLTQPLFQVFLVFGIVDSFRFSFPSKATQFPYVHPGVIQGTMWGSMKYVGFRVTVMAKNGIYCMIQGCDYRALARVLYQDSLNPES